MRTVSVRTVLFGLAASTAALLLSACGSDAEGTIVIYTGRHYDLETAFNGELSPDELEQQLGMSKMSKSTAGKKYK